jgi:hypothetical protein
LARRYPTSNITFLQEHLSWKRQFGVRRVEESSVYGHPAFDGGGGDEAK